jgi:LacI family transcriptional regulator
MSKLQFSSRRQEIALAIRVGVPHLERVAQGIREFAQAHTEWRFLVSPETHDLPPVSLKGWRGDGVIALCNTQEDERVLRGLGCPVVNISGALRRSHFPRVRNDYREIGRGAALYLRQRGFRRFGFYGVSGVWYSEEIEKGYCESIETLGFSVEALRSASTIGDLPRWDQGQEELERWLLSMEAPFAILAAHDPRATMVIRACERIGLRVPTDVAVIGVNDDTGTCETSRPTLTSIERDGNAVGWRVAKTLNRMIEGEMVESEIVLPPGGIRERESTGAFAVEHAALVAAVRFVEEHYGESIGVDQIAEASEKSRRWLEEAFRRELNRSPSEFLKETGVEAAGARLAEERGVGIGVLAGACGFSGTRQINEAFRRLKGVGVREFLGDS